MVLVEQIVESMSELVEKSCYLIQVKKSRHIAVRICKVENTSDYRGYCFSSFDMIAAISSAPCSLMFAFARMKVHVKDPKMRSVIILDFKGLCIRMGKRNICNRRKCDSVELVCASEHSFDNIFKLKIRTKLRVVQIIFLLP